MQLCSMQSSSAVYRPTATLADTSSGGPDHTINLPTIPTWARRVLGTLFFLALPFYKRTVTIEDEVETDIETTVRVVEKVAVVAEKVAVDVTDALPPDGKLRKVALEAEHITERVAKDAEGAQVIIHKVDEIKEKIEDFVMVEKEDFMAEWQAKEMASQSERSQLKISKVFSKASTIEESKLSTHK